MSHSMGVLKARSRVHAKCVDTLTFISIMPGYFVYLLHVIRNQDNSSALRVQAVGEVKSLK
jgi:hypothetical protein